MRTPSFTLNIFHVNHYLALRIRGCKRAQFPSRYDRRTSGTQPSVSNCTLKNYKLQSSTEILKIKLDPVNYSICWVISPIRQYVYACIYCWSIWKLLTAYHRAGNYYGLNKYWIELHILIILIKKNSFNILYLIEETILSRF